MTEEEKLLYWRTHIPVDAQKRLKELEIQRAKKQAYDLIMEEIAEKDTARRRQEYEQQQKILDAAKESIRVISVKYLSTFVPKGSCGTGYSEPSKYEFTYIKTNDISKFYTCQAWIDTWYLPKEYWKEAFTNGIKDSELNNFKVKNIESAYLLWEKVEGGGKTL